MTTVGNIGIGLFILIIIWILALVFFVIAVRLQSNLGWVGLSAATVISVIFAVIPIESGSKDLDDFVPEDKDYSLIYKYLLLTILSGSACLAFLVVFVTYCIEPIRPKPVKTF